MIIFGLFPSGFAAGPVDGFKRAGGTAKGMDEDEGKSQSEAWRNLEDKFSIAPMTSESLEAFAENVDGVMGMGFIPY